MLKKDNEWCKRCPLEQKILQCMPSGRFIKVYNKDNPRLFSVIAANTPILDEMCKTNPDRIPTPEPLDAVYLPGPPSSHGRSGRSRRKKKKPKKLQEDLWGT